MVDGNNIELVYDDKTHKWKQLNEELVMQLVFDSKEDMAIFEEYIKGFEEFAKTYKNRSNK